MINEVSLLTSCHKKQKWNVFWCCVALPEGLQLTGLAMVNLRPQSGLQDISKLMDGNSGTRWGNKFGMLLLPVYYHRGSSDPIQFVERSKAMIDSKKLSLEGPFSYSIGNLLMSLFGPKVSSVFTCWKNWKEEGWFHVLSCLDGRLLAFSTTGSFAIQLSLYQTWSALVNASWSRATLWSA